MPSPAASTGSHPLRIAVLVKQVPRGEEIRLAPDGRLVREGVPLEMNAFCRRAVSRAVSLARDSGGTVSVFTLGPASAEDVLREAVAWGADEGIHLTDAAFAGSDALATAGTLATALRQLGPWDLILVGRNSIDADTGQVGPTLAQLLDLLFAGAARQLDVAGDELQLLCQTDDVSRSMTVALPAVIAVAERLCEPAKVPEERRREVDPAALRRLGAANLGPGPWGQAGSPTRVTGVREIASPRAQLRLPGTPAEQAAQLLAALKARGALLPVGREASTTATGRGARQAAGGGPAIAVLDEGDRPEEMRQLLTLANALADDVDGRVTAVVPGPPDPVYVGTLSSWGADAVLALEGVLVAEDVAAAVASWAQRTAPWAVLASSTGWGREVASRVAAVLGAGLTGDALAVEVRQRRLVAWKPSFAARFDAAVEATSPTQLVTVRPGAVAAGPLRAAADLPVAVERVRPGAGSASCPSTGRTTSASSPRPAVSSASDWGSTRRSTRCCSRCKRCCAPSSRPPERSPTAAGCP